MTETFNKDLFNFAKNYTNKYVVRIMNHSREIAANEMLCDMLHELTIREEKELERFEREFIYVMKNFDGEPVNPDHFDCYRHDCLQNAKSYRDVIHDYVWKIIDEPPF